MKYLILLSTILSLTATCQLNAQPDPSETTFMSMVVPAHYIKKHSEEGIDLYESKNNRSILSMTKEYKGAEDGFISAQAAADFLYQSKSSDDNNLEVNVVTEKIGKMNFTVVSWVEKGEKKLSRNFMRAYNDEGQFIHHFEMSSSASNKKQLDKAFRSFLKTCKPNK